jgi:transcriptional regulator with XRE-family HTH domain
MNKDDEHLGTFIRSRRQAVGWSLDDLEIATGLDDAYLGRIERGEIKRPDAGKLARIATALDLPLADIYALAGYTPARRLPTFRRYFRAKYHLPPEAIEQLEGYFAFLRHQYGIPVDEPVFPPKHRGPRKRGPKPKPPEPRPTGGPWDDPAISRDRRTA